MLTAFLTALRGKPWLVPLWAVLCTDVHPTESDPDHPPSRNLKAVETWDQKDPNSKRVLVDMEGASPMGGEEGFLPSAHKAKAKRTCYLLPCDKLPSSLQVQNTTRSLSHGFHGSGVRVHPNWGPLPRVCR